MKKILLWMLVVSMIVVFSTVGSLVGCKPAAEEEAVVEEEVAEEEVAAPAEEEEVVVKTPEEYVGEITLIGFNDEFDTQGVTAEGEPDPNKPSIIESFNAVYPNITVNFTKIPYGEIVNKLESAFLTGVGIPDVFVGDQDWVKKWIQYDVWENISAAPYNADALVADYIPYVKDMATDEEGNLRALSFQAAPGGVYYRRSIADDVFGVSEPADVSALMTTMDDFLDMGRTLKDEGIYLIPGYADIQRLFFSRMEQPWVVDGKLVVDDAILEYFDVAKIIRDEGLDAKLDIWSPEWFAGMNADDVFCYVMPTWGLFFVIAPAASDTYGDWGAATAPFPYLWGGTWLGIAKESENKELAWEFVKFVGSNEEFLESWSRQRGDLTPIISVVEGITDYENEFLGGQNHLAYFLEEAKKIDASKIGYYDEECKNQILIAIGDYINGNLTKDEAVQSFKDSVLAVFPELTAD